MKKTWIVQFDAINLALRTIDPADLIQTGAPNDEYEIEALALLLKKQRGLLNKENVLEQIKDVFLESFGSIEDASKIQAIADRITNIE